MKIVTCKKCGTVEAFMEDIQRHKCDCCGTYAATFNGEILAKFDIEEIEEEEEL